MLIKIGVFIWFMLFSYQSREGVGGANCWVDHPCPLIPISQEESLTLAYLSMHLGRNSVGKGLSSIEKSLIPWYRDLWKMVASQGKFAFYWWLAQLGKSFPNLFGIFSQQWLRWLARRAKKRLKALHVSLRKLKDPSATIPCGRPLISHFQNDGQTYFYGLLG